MWRTANCMERRLFAKMEPLVKHMCVWGGGRVRGRWVVMFLSTQRKGCKWPRRESEGFIQRSWRVRTPIKMTQMQPSSWDIFTRRCCAVSRRTDSALTE